MLGSLKTTLALFDCLFGNAGGSLCPRKICLLPSLIYLVVFFPFYFIYRRAIIDFDS